MFRLIKWLLILGILGFAAFVVYAYVGPFFGADFSPPQSEIRDSVTLETQ